MSVFLVPVPEYFNTPIWNISLGVSSEQQNAVTSSSIVLLGRKTVVTRVWIISGFDEIVEWKV